MVGNARGRLSNIAGADMNRINLAIRHAVSLIFIIQMYLAMAVLAIYYTPLSLFGRIWAVRGIHTYCAWVRWSAAWMLGLYSEIRGNIPTGEVLVCAKHQSFLDILLIVGSLPRPRFVMKAELKWAPILGYFALRIGCIPVERGKKARAVQQMIQGVRAASDWPGQLIIYPQGTRVAPGASKPYKIGPGILYGGLNQPCVPAATNVGLFWPRRAILRKPGLAVVEFLAPIPPGKPVREFMVELETLIETASNRLMREAGFDPDASSG